MRSVTSYFNPTVARSDLRHYWPLLFGYVGVWVLLLPLRVWNYRTYTVVGDSSFLQARGEALLRACVDNYATAIIMALLFGMAMTMAVFSYMMNTRSIGAMHALPIRRSGLFATHFLTGFGMLTAGNLFVALLTFLAALSAGVPLHRALLTWLLLSTLLNLFFMALTALCVVLTGWLLAVPVLYAAANGGVIALTLLGYSLASLLMEGYSYNYDFTAPVRWLTPLYQMFHGICQSGSAMLYARTNAECLSGLSPQGWQTLLWYGLASLLLLALACFLYARRKSELSGDAVAFRWLRPVFRLGIGLSGGLASGLLLYFIIALYTGEENPMATLLFSLILMGAICYFAAAMLVNKTLRVFRSGWKGAALTALVLVLACVCLRMDITGYSRRVPDREDVAMVTARLGMAGLEEEQDPAAVEAVLALHHAILSDGDPVSTEHGSYFNVTYTLTDGRRVIRSFTCAMDSPAVSQALPELLALPAVQRNFLLDKQDATDDTRFYSGYVCVYGDEETETVELTAPQAQALYQAALSDADQGRVVQDLKNIDTLNLSIELYGEENYCGIYRLTPTCTDTLSVLTDILGYLPR